MASRSAKHLFGSFTYEKTVSEILTKVGQKITAVRAKVQEREGRIARLRQEFDITDQELVDVLAQAARNNGVSSYSVSNMVGEFKVIGAGVVQNILTERNLIHEERETIARLELIQRNLGNITQVADNGIPYLQTTFRLGEDDLEFLGF